MAFLLSFWGLRGTARAEAAERPRSCRKPFQRWNLDQKGTLSGGIPSSTNDFRFHRGPIMIFVSIVARSCRRFQRWNLDRQGTLSRGLLLSTNDLFVSWPEHVGSHSSGGISAEEHFVGEYYEWVLQVSTKWVFFNWVLQESNTSEYYKWVLQASATSENYKSVLQENTTSE